MRFFLSFICALLVCSAFAQDSLLYYNNGRITDAATWEKRRGELEHQVLKQIYGFMPPAPKWRSQVVKEVVLKDGNILYKEVAIQLLKDDAPTRTIRLALFIPTNQTKPVPVVVAINKCGNCTVTASEEVGIYPDRILHPKCKEAMKERGGTHESLRGLQTNYWALDSVIKRGYAFATFHDSDIGADTASLDQGIFPFYPELQNETGWKLISAWAWGLQRAVDYLVTDGGIDSSRVIVFGHSRRGKAALLAAALDERIAMAVPHQSGTGGMALGKKHPIESIKRINKTFPYWFNDRFKTYKRKTLPLDQHYLAAMVAPRPLLETTGKYDVWSSYWLSLRTLRRISPVYALYGKTGLTGKGKVSKRKKLHQAGTIVQVRRPYRHTMNADYWRFILDFADERL